MVDIEDADFSPDLARRAVAVTCDAFRRSWWLIREPSFRDVSGPRYRALRGVAANAAPAPMRAWRSWDQGAIHG
jgi:hypothetical protein